MRNGIARMKKLKILLALLTIAIIVVPITLEVILYRDNLFGLIVPPEIANMINGDRSKGNGGSIVNSQFELPQPVGEPQYNPETKSVSFIFNFTNPLETPITVNKLQAGIFSHDDNVFLGNITIDKPLTINPGQTMDITASGTLSDNAINYLQDNYRKQESINLDLTDLNVDLAGISVKVDRQNLGYLAIPSELFGWQIRR